MNLRTISLLTATAFSCAFTPASQAAEDQQDAIRNAVNRAIQPLMAKDDIAGMAVGVIVGDKHYVLNYGVASKETSKPVTRDTLFELGSVSKTLTATLASYAQVSGYLSLSDPTSKFLPSLQQSPFGKVSLLNLGTHTPGGLPLQVPDNIHNNDQLLQYFQAWQPTYAPGTYRTYANPGIGALGLITAKSMGQNFNALMEHQLFPALGMKSSYIDIPAAKLPDYAQGYTKAGAPIRMAPGVLSSEAYGIKATADDMVRFLEANMNLIQVAPKLQRAAHDSGSDMGTISLSGHIADASGRELIGDGLQRNARHANQAAAGSQRRCLDQQDRIDQRLRRLHRIRSAEAVGHRHPRQQELPH
jgi:beta-lactamase class C